MTIPTLGGAVWSDQWRSPGEGPYTLIAKLLRSNVLPASYMKKLVHHNAQCGASLLALRPPIGVLEPQATWSRVLNEASIERIAPTIFRHIAGKKHFRYCRQCMGSGFQAAIAQIDGFSHCPLHNEPLHTECLYCGASTPAYELSQFAPQPRLSCHKCQASYGSLEALDNRLDLWRVPENVNRLAHIDSWLGQIDGKADISWLNIDKWDLASLSGEGRESIRRQAIFQTLLALVPDPSIPSPGLSIEIFGPFELRRSVHVGDLSWKTYLSFPPHMASFEELSPYARHISTSDCGSQLAPHPSVPVEVHASLLWRAQFKTISCIGHQWLEPLNTDFFDDKYIPFKTPAHKRCSATEDRHLWHGLMSAAWAATKRIAQQWHGYLIQQKEQLGPSANLEQLYRSAALQPNHLMCWQTEQYQPIGRLVQIDRTSSPNKEYVYFVVA